MDLSPKYIKENINKIGFKEARDLLNEIISNSNNLTLRREALEVYGYIDKGKDFKFFEQLFLSDENYEMRLIAGRLLKERYFSHKNLISLLEFTLYNVDNINQKFLAIEILNSLNSKKTRKIIKDYLKKSIKLKLMDKISEFPEEIFNFDYNTPIPESILSICFNLILNDFYIDKCGYNVTLRKGLIILLNCEGSNITNILDIPAFEKLVDLEHLLLQRNNIRKLSGLNHLKNLRMLNLSGNRIEKIENLDYLKSLEELNLSSNQIKKIENLKLGNLKKLKIDHNNLSEIQNLDGLCNLEFLNLSNNRISEIKKLRKLKKMKNLSLSYNNIETISGLENLLNLIILHLNNNKIKNIDGLERLSNLKILNLSNNLIEHIENLNNLTNLTKLELSNNNIEKLEGLNHLYKLQELFLDKNQITRLEGLDNLENLIILFLEKNKISEFNFKDIEHLKSLNFIFLNENPLTPESRRNYIKKTRFP